MKIKGKGKESKLNVALTATLVVFVCLLSFSVGVISGKGWSDREYTVRYIENDGHLKTAKEDNEPLGDEMTQKEVEMLTKRALEEAKAEAPQVSEEPNENVGEPEKTSMLDQMESEADAGEETIAKNETTNEPKPKGDKEEAGPLGRDASEAKREVSSLIPKPTTPKPTAVDYTVQVAAYKTLNEAEAHSQKLIDKGFPAFPVKAMIKGDLWYRVSIGSFKTRKRAMKYESELKKQAVVKTTFVQKITRLKN